MDATTTNRIEALQGKLENPDLTATAKTQARAELRRLNLNSRAEHAKAARSRSADDARLELLEELSAFDPTVASDGAIEIGMAGKIPLRIRCSERGAELGPSGFDVRSLTPTQRRNLEALASGLQARNARKAGGRRVTSVQSAIAWLAERLPSISVALGAE